MTIPDQDSRVRLLDPMLDDLEVTLMARNRYRSRSWKEIRRE